MERAAFALILNEAIELKDDRPQDQDDDVARSLPFLILSFASSAVSFFALGSTYFVHF